MITIVGISGSLRKYSFNSGLLRASLEALPEGCSLKIGSIAGIPLYNADVEEAEQELSANQSQPSGRLNITAPVMFGKMHVAPAITRFLQTHHRVSVDFGPGAL